MFSSLFLIFYLLSILCSPSNANKCDQEVLDGSFVTVCGLNKCEDLFEINSEAPHVSNQISSEWPKTKDEVIQISSSRAGNRFKITRHKAMDTIEFYYEETHVNGTIFVDTNVTYQRILGFGSTLTDASCANLDELPKDLRKRLIDEYFGIDKGISLNLLKIPIGSTKFSYTNYALEHPDGQNKMVELSSYDIDHRIPLIKDAMESAGRYRNRIKLVAFSPSAPTYLKDNNQLIHGGSLKSDNIDAYASYLLGFVEAYRSHDLNIWSMILSEAPATIGRYSDKFDELDYNSMAMRPSDTVRLVEAIGSEARRQNLVQNRQPKLLLLGDDKCFIQVWSDKVFATTGSKVAGVAYKCRSDEPSTYDNLLYVSRKYPSKYLLASEATINTPMKLGNWQYAENYATEIVKNLEFGSVGWIDSNLMLDLNGGPTVSSKYRADAAIIVDQRRSVYYRNPMFYAIGHLSRYVRPGSVRVKMDFFSSAHMFARQHIAFITPENYLVVFVMNNNIGPMPINIGINKRTKVESLLDTKSFNTFIFKL